MVFGIMAPKNMIRFILVLIHVSSCFGRSGKMFSPGFISAAKSLPSWPIFSAGISVTVALVLSLFLTLEHLCAYHQPEVIFFPKIILFMSGIYFFDMKDFILE
jgi:hypothetical protein